MEVIERDRIAEPSRAPGPGLRLLVVEDHGDLRTALRMFFDLLSYEAWFVGNVAAALRAAWQESFDVLLSDIGLPDGNGWDMLRRLGATGHRPPYAIAMSGHYQSGHEAISKATGFAHHLNKPFSAVDLENALVAAGKPARRK